MMWENRFIASHESIATESIATEPIAASKWINESEYHFAF